MGSSPLIKILGFLSVLGLGLVFGMALPAVDNIVPQIALGFALKLVGAVIAAFVLFAILRVWDLLIGISFATKFTQMNLAHATYFAARIIGLCFLLAAVLFA